MQNRNENGIFLRGNRKNGTMLSCITDTENGTFHFCKYGISVYTMGQWLLCNSIIKQHIMRQWAEGAMGGPTYTIPHMYSTRSTQLSSAITILC